jgi:hypothetical protein
MPEETAGSASENAKLEQQTDPAVLKLLVDWRRRKPALYVVARIGSSMAIHARGVITELVRENGGGFLLYIGNPGFGPEFESELPGRNGLDTTRPRSRLLYLWRLQLRNFQVVHSGSVLTLRADALQIDLSERPLRPVGDTYYGDDRIVEWWG